MNTDACTLLVFRNVWYASLPHLCILRLMSIGCLHGVNSRLMCRAVPLVRHVAETVTPDSQVHRMRRWNISSATKEP